VATNFVPYSVNRKPHAGNRNRAGFKRGKLPRGLHQNSKKIITQGNMKILFETDDLE